MLKFDIIKTSAPFGPDFNTNLLKPKSALFSKFWKNKSLNPIVSRKLNSIADDIIESMDFEEGVVKDIIITGSIASYNWHALSDIDLHIMLDFNMIDDNFSLVKRMLDQTRINWNKKHNIHIAGKEVELYFQHFEEPHEANGIWSLSQEKWLAEPVLLNPEIDIITTEKKAEALAQSIEHLFEIYKRKEYKDVYEYCNKLKDKIAKMRQSGLASDGIYSPENLAFKMLRNAGYLTKLSSLKIQSYDKMMSLKLENKDKVSFNKKWKVFTTGEKHDKI
tara:strand:- start:75 stop:905 length:831 start_codon:yes stop_codon:yes gene_type:complete